MGVLLMQHFTWEGKEKKAYDIAPQQKGMKAYLCDVCGKYHLAKSKKNRRRFHNFLRG